MKDNLSYLLSTIEFASAIENGSNTLNNYEEAILKQQPKWQQYLEQQSETLQQAIKIFKNYDKTGKLKFFLQSIKTKNVVLNEGVFKDLVQYALSAYDHDNLDDAYKMFSFISTYYPRHYKTYLYLGSIIQSLYGPQQASVFFKTTTSIFTEPDLLFLAAENEVQCENTAGAYDYLQKAENILLERSHLTEEEEGLKIRIEELLKIFCS